MTGLIEQFLVSYFNSHVGVVLKYNGRFGFNIFKNSEIDFLFDKFR